MGVKKDLDIVKKHLVAAQKNLSDLDRDSATKSLDSASTAIANVRKTYEAKKKKTQTALKKVDSDIDTLTAIVKADYDPMKALKLLQDAVKEITVAETAAKAD